MGDLVSMRLRLGEEQGAHARGDDGCAPEPGPASGSASGEERSLSMTLPGERMTLAARAALAIRSWVAVALERKPAKGSILDRLLTAKPPSIAEHMAYVGSREWVPRDHPAWEEHRQGERKRKPGTAGAIWGKTAALAGVAAGNAIAALFHKPLRLAIFLAACGAVDLVIVLAH